MTSSPTSTVASSELYPTSEPVEHEVGSQDAQSLIRRRDRPPPSASDIQALELKLAAGPEVTPKDPDEPQGPKAAGSDEVVATSGSVTDSSETSDRDFIRTSQKRKRDDDIEYPPFVQAGPVSAVRMEPLPYPNGTTSVPSMNHTSGNADTRPFEDEWSSKTRSRSNDVTLEPLTRVENSSHLSDLPMGIWQHIFCFVPPVFLGRLLRVNRAFNAYLTAGDANQQYSKPTYSGVLKALDPNAVWAASRQRFCPGLPKPIRGLLELDMWRLLRGGDCQLCGAIKDSSSFSNFENPWELGPGETGVRVVWPWGVRLCGQCMLNHSEKEVNLLFSPDSSLLPGLPFAFVSSSNHYVTSFALRSAAAPPALNLFKRYYKIHIDQIRKRLHTARELGDPSAEEWFKGLEQEGKEILEDVIRWEQWEAKGGLKKVNQPPHVRPAGMIGSVATVIKTGNKKVETPSDFPTPQELRLPAKPNRESDGPANITPVTSAYIPPKLTSSFQSTWITSAPFSENVTQRPLAPFPTRPERSIREVNEAKANRRLEIERRCAALDPPLLPNFLGHMEAFQAAIQISQPLNEQAWQVLKPRLLAQRAYAERRENERAAQTQILLAEQKQRRLQEAQLKETRENLDREWDSIQIPIRAHIARLAEERIESKWASGKSLNKENCPKFAADVLLYVRQKFYDEIRHEDEANLTLSETMKVDAPDRSASRMLILENMKWLFDNHIKPLTETFQKELFLCNGCDGNFKFYGLESVVQHYAAKHTTSLSLGNQVVHWRAEWPEHPPFHPEPSVAKAAYYKIPTPLITSSQGPPGRERELFNQFGGFGQRAPQELNGMPHFAIEPYKGPYRDLYAEQQEQQIRNYSPSLTQDNSYIPSSAGQPQSFYPSPNDGAVYPGPQIFHNGVIQNPSLPSSLSDYGSQAYNPQLSFPPVAEPSEPLDRRNSSWYGSETFGRQNVLVSVTSSYPNLPLKPTNTHVPHSDSTKIGQFNDMYNHQVDEMARHARDVWSATSGIKDIPQSVRIFVVIQETTNRFKAMFPNEPSLIMFIDGLEHNDSMRPIRSLKGLACKVCVTNGGGAGGGQFSHTQLPVGYRSLHTLPELLNHFKTAHVEPFRQPFDGQNTMRSPGPDWKFDMIELPDSRLIADLVNAPGMDDTKLELLAKIFPTAFPSPLPRLGTSGNSGAVPIYTEGLGTRVIPPQRAIPEGYPASPARTDLRYESQPLSRVYSGFREPSQPARASEPPGEDEYDPHRPADLGKIVPLGMSSMLSRKPMRTPPAVEGKLATPGPTHPDHPYILPDMTDSSHLTRPAAPLSTFAGIDSSNQPRVQGHGSHHSLSSQGDIVEDPYQNRSREHHRQRTPVEQDGDLSHSGLVAYSHIFEGHTLGESLIPVPPGERGQSPHEGASAADEFLDNLASASNLSHTRKYTPGDHEENTSVAKQRDLSSERQWDGHSDVAPDDKRGRVGGRCRQRRETDLPSIPSRTGSCRSKIYDEGQPSLPERSYDENICSRSPIGRGVNSKRRIGSTEMYPAFEVSRGALIRDHYDMGQSHIRDSSFRATRTSRYGNRSRSPRPIPPGTTYYRTRTPEERTFEPVYHVRSPSDRSDIRAQRIIGYERPAQDHYEYIDQQRRPERHYRQPVEYVPLRMREHASLEPSRFVTAQLPDTRPPPDYLRINRDYDGEPVYEHNGQLYHAGPRPYEAQPHFGPLAYTPGYRY